MPSYNSTHTGTQIDNAVDTYQTQSQVQTLINSAIEIATTQIQSQVQVSINSAIETAVAQTKLAMYPIGSIYMSLESTNPATFIGGTWEQIEDTFLLAAGTNYSAGDTGGKAEYVADDMPAHTHTRGTMDITGSFKLDPTNGWIRINTVSGCFTKSGSEAIANGGTPNGGAVNNQCNFKASNNWTGETSQSGLEETATIMPPYLAVYMWKRTA